MFIGVLQKPFFNFRQQHLNCIVTSLNLMPTNQEVKGNALKIYLYLLKHGASQLRDIQRGTELSSASLASYHLSKMMEGGFVKQDEHGAYFVENDASEKVLEGYLKVGKAVVPQLFFFSLLFSILVGFFSFAVLFWQGYAPYLVAVCIGMVIVLWYQTVKVWRRLSL
jgi:hypothetical protein